MYFKSLGFLSFQFITNSIVIIIIIYISKVCMLRLCHVFVTLKSQQISCGPFFHIVPPMYIYYYVHSYLTTYTDTMVCLQPVLAAFRYHTLRKVAQAKGNIHIPPQPGFKPQIYYIVIMYVLSCNWLSMSHMYTIMAYGNQPCSMRKWVLSYVHAKFDHILEI